MTLSERLTTKGYECTECQRTHFDFQHIYAPHLLRQSKNGITSYSPFAVAQVLDNQKGEHPA